MKGIKGQLSSLPLTDLMQWIDMNKKSGVLFIYGDSMNTCFCFEEGKLLMGASKENGKRLGDFLTSEGQVQIDSIRKACSESRSEGVSLLGYLLNKKIVPREFLSVSIQQMAEEVIAEVLSLEDGSFEFVEELPDLFINTPIKLNTNFIVFEAVRKFDELRRKQQQGE
jgi:hypothetical protein